MDSREECAQAILMVTSVSILRWFDKIRARAQDYLPGVQGYGFDEDTANHEAVQQMYPKGLLYPFMDDIIANWQDEDVRLIGFYLTFE